MGLNVPLNLAHASMLQHPISTDCNSDGIPISSRRNPETISKKHRTPQKNSTSRKIFTTLFPITFPSPTPFSYAPPFASHCTKSSCIYLNPDFIHYALLLSFCFLKITILQICIVFLLRSIEFLFRYRHP